MPESASQADQDISLITVSNERELDRYNVDQLAMELTGKAVDRMFPIYLVFHKGKLRGYFQAVQQTCVYPAIHPETMHAKEYQKLMSNLVREIKRATGNPLFLLCGKAKQFDAKSMRNFGVRKCAADAYEYWED